MRSDLLALALRRDSGARDELAAQLTRMRREEALDEGARIQLEALLEELREVVSPAIRLAIDAARTELVGSERAPKAGSRNRKRHLSEAELTELASAGNARRLTALARRPDLPQRVSAILVARGCQPALCALAENRSATIASPVLVAMAECALDDPKLRSLLIARSDLPEDAISHLWPCLTDNDKAAVLAACAPYGQRDALEFAAEAERRLHAALRRGELPESVDALMATVEDGIVSPDGAITRLCVEVRFADLAEFLAQWLSSRFLPCLNLLAMASERGPTLLCRVGGFSRENYGLVAKLRRDLGYRSAESPSAGVDILDALSPSAARRIFAAYEEITAGLR